MEVARLVALEEVVEEVTLSHVYAMCTRPDQQIGGE